MNLPRPLLGLVVEYNFLWGTDKKDGLELSRKNRPSAVILHVETGAGSTMTMIAPISHTPPHGASEGVRLPAAEARALGLDGMPMWIKTTEFNFYRWGPERLRRAYNRESCAYGRLSKKTYDAVKAQALANIGAGSAAVVTLEV